MNDKLIFLITGGRSGYRTGMLAAAHEINAIISSEYPDGIEQEPHASINAATPSGIRPANAPGCRYPEQSSRQAMRAYRRAQGGPGLVLDADTGQYNPRAAQILPHQKEAMRLWFGGMRLPAA